MQPTTSTSHSHPERHRNQNQRLSPRDRPNINYRQISTTTDGLLSPPQPIYNEYRFNDVKGPRVTVIAVPPQPSQQRVP